MKTIRAELVRDVIVLSALLGAALVFPYGSVGFRAGDPPVPQRPLVSFVKLTDAEEDAALRAAKSSWQMEANALRGDQAWLPLGELPEEPSGPILPHESLPRPNTLLPLTAFRPSAWQPTQAASAPRRIVAEADEKRPTFTRDDLLALP